MSEVRYIVNSIDVSIEIETNSLTIYQRMTKGIDTAVFTMLNPDISPVAGNSVVIYVDNINQKIFAGLIISTSKIKLVPGEWKYIVSCTDYKRLFDKRLVVETYEDATVLAIVQDIIDNFTDTTLGFTIVNVVSFPTFGITKFNYRYPSDCLTELAEQNFADWYIDYDKGVHLYSAYSMGGNAPYEINDITLQYEILGFNFSVDYSQIRNGVWVRGGYSLSDTLTEFRVADGQQRAWTIPDRFQDMAVTVDSVPKTPMGEQYIDKDDGTYPYLYNRGEKKVMCAEAEVTPADGDVIEFSYKSERPALVYVSDDASIVLVSAAEEGDGIYQYIYSDKNIGSWDAAKAKGKTEINKYKNPLISGSFSTHEYGFKVGQKIIINVTGCDYNTSVGDNPYNYILKELTITSIGNNILLYTGGFSN